MAHKLVLETTDTGLPPTSDATVKLALTQFREALVANFSRIETVRNSQESSEVKVGASLTFDFGGTLPVVGLKFSVKSKPWVWEVKDVIEDPNQTQLPI